MTIVLLVVGACSHRLGTNHSSTDTHTHLPGLTLCTKGRPRRHGDGQRRSLHIMITHCARFASSVLSWAMRCLVWVNRCGFTCARVQGGKSNE